MAYKIVYNDLGILYSLASRHSQPKFIKLYIPNQWTVADEDMAGLFYFDNMSDALEYLDIQQKAYYNKLELWECDVEETSLGRALNTYWLAERLETKKIESIRKEVEACRNEAQKMLQFPIARRLKILYKHC